MRFKPRPEKARLYFTAKTARRLRGYLIRLTREYTDGGMDSRAELNQVRSKFVCLAGTWSKKQNREILNV